MNLKDRILQNNYLRGDTNVIYGDNSSLYVVLDESGSSYIFPGCNESNYVKFANFWWRIVRINGDGSVRLIYQGTNHDSTGAEAGIGYSVFNTNVLDNTYVGYMYGEEDSEPTNIHNSDMKMYLENWYQSNLLSYDNYIDYNAIFWYDRKPGQGTGIGKEETYYGAYTRASNGAGSLRASVNRDMYSSTVANKGNKVLTYPIGLLTLDEVLLSLNLIGSKNTNFYNIGYRYWIASPFAYNPKQGAYVTQCTDDCTLTNLRVDASQTLVRPVINLKGTLLSTGSGTPNDPYEVYSQEVPSPGSQPQTYVNNTLLERIYFNGVDLDKAYLNNTIVFSKDKISTGGITYIITDVNNNTYNNTVNNYEELKYLLYDMHNAGDHVKTVKLSGKSTLDTDGMNGLFGNYSSITSIDLSELDTSNVTMMISTFAFCSNLTSLNLSNLNTSNVLSMAQLFALCSSLPSVDISSFDTSKVRDMTSMFLYTDSLVSLDCSSFNTSSCTNMSQMFAGRGFGEGPNALTNLNVSSFDTSNVTDMHMMFYSLINLKTLDITNFDTSSNLDFSRMFGYDHSLKTIYCNDDWNREGEELEDTLMFVACTDIVGAIPYDHNKVGLSVANPNTGYFTRKEVA